jgi:hypothetical protein
MTGPLLDNPAFISPAAVAAPPCENPVFVPLGNWPSAYHKVFETVLDVVDDYFVIDYANTSRYGGTIRTLPGIAPGLEQFFKPGSPDFDGRLLATFQTIRHYAIVKIDRAPDGGGFWIDVKVYKELEDLPRPLRMTAGAAAFRSDITVERQFEVIEPTFTATGWIPIGEDTKLEQTILQRIKKCL